MKLFEELRLKFEDGNWARNPELIRMAEEDVSGGSEEKQFGKKDTPSEGCDIQRNKEP